MLSWQSLSVRSGYVDSIVVGMVIKDTLQGWPLSHILWIMKINNMQEKLKEDRSRTGEYTDSIIKLNDNTVYELIQECMYLGATKYVWPSIHVCLI